MKLKEAEYYNTVIVDLRPLKPYFETEYDINEGCIACITSKAIFLKKNIYDKETIQINMTKSMTELRSIYDELEVIK